MQLGVFSQLYVLGKKGGRDTVEGWFVAIEDGNSRTIALLECAHRVTFQCGDAGRSDGEDLVAHSRGLMVWVPITALLIAPLQVSFSVLALPRFSWQPKRGMPDDVRQFLWRSLYNTDY